MSKHYLTVLALVAGLMTLGMGTANAEPTAATPETRELSFQAMGRVANDVILTVDATVEDPTTMTVYLFGCEGTERPIQVSLQRGSGQLSVPLTTASNTFDENLSVTAVFTNAEGERETVTRTPNAHEIDNMKARFGAAMGCNTDETTEVESPVIVKSEPQKPLVKAWSVKRKMKSKKLGITATKVNGPATVSYKWFVKGAPVKNGKSLTYKPKRAGKVTVKIEVRSNGKSEARIIRLR